MDSFIIISLAISMAIWISPSVLNIFDILILLCTSLLAIRFLKLLAWSIFCWNIDDFLTPFAPPQWPPRLFLPPPPTIPQGPLPAPIQTTATPAPFRSAQNDSSEDLDDSENDEDTLSNGFGDVSVLGISTHHNIPDNSTPSTAFESSDDKIESPVPRTTPWSPRSPRVTRLHMLPRTAFESNDDEIESPVPGTTLWSPRSPRVTGLSKSSSTAFESSDDEIESPVPGTTPWRPRSPQFTRLPMSLLELTHGNEDFDLSQIMPREFITDIHEMGQGEGHASFDSGVGNDLVGLESVGVEGSILSRQRPVGRRLYEEVLKRYE